MSSFKELKVWQKAMSLAKEIYQVSANFPHQEQYGLTSQIRRSAISIPSNIAEGKNRNSKLEFKRFINIALGSAAELETQIILSHDLGYTEAKVQKELLDQIEEIGKMLNGLSKSI